MGALTIRTTVETDWERVRDLRLEMLRDTPIAYLETVETALARTEDEWRERAARGDTASSRSLVAVLDGRWVGTMTGLVSTTGLGPLLVGVYVAPAARGAGVADALLDAVELWAAGHGTTLTLHVHEANARARAFYARRGFVETGATIPYPLDPYAREVEMREILPDAP
jgi:GNAT superfamily N-acetyltransferase